MIKSCRGQVNAFGREVTFAVYAEARNQGPSEMIYVSCTPKLLRPEKVRRLILGPVLAAFSGLGGSGQLARALILTRLWLNTPCPHQMEAPSRPSSRVRSQPYPRLR